MNEIEKDENEYNLTERERDTLRASWYVYTLNYNVFSSSFSVCTRQFSNMILTAALYVGNWIQSIGLCYDQAYNCVSLKQLPYSRTALTHAICCCIWGKANRNACGSQSLFPSKLAGLSKHRIVLHWHLCTVFDVKPIIFTYLNLNSTWKSIKANLNSLQIVKFSALTHWKNGSCCETRRAILSSGLISWKISRVEVSPPPLTVDLTREKTVWAWFLNFNKPFVILACLLKIYHFYFGSV